MKMFEKKIFSLESQFDLRFNSKSGQPQVSVREQPLRGKKVYKVRNHQAP